MRPLLSAEMRLSSRFIRPGPQVCPRVWSCPCVRSQASGYTPNSPSRSEEHTSELQSLMRISYAVFCLKKKNIMNNTHDTQPTQHMIHQLTMQGKHKQVSYHQDK